jgi:hypothetical protein
MDRYSKAKYKSFGVVGPCTCDLMMMGDIEEAFKPFLSHETKPQ